MGGKYIYVSAPKWERVFVWKGVSIQIHIYIDALRLC